MCPVLSIPSNGAKSALAGPITVAVVRGLLAVALLLRQRFLALLQLVQLLQRVVDLIPKAMSCDPMGRC